MDFDWVFGRELNVLGTGSLRRILGCRWLDHVSNERLLRESLMRPITCNGTGAPGSPGKVKFCLVGQLVCMFKKRVGECMPDVDILSVCLLFSGYNKRAHWPCHGTPGAHLCGGQQD